MRIKEIIAFSALAIAAPFVAQADPPTPDPAPNGSVIETRINIDVDKKTDTVHLVSDTNDPDIITKVYILKHADPYELRPYIRTAVGAHRIDGDSTFVECIKFSDGTGALIVSGEDYKFDHDKLSEMAGRDCLCVDEIVEMLDQPKITSSSGQPKLMFFPKYRSAAEIDQLMRNVGLNGVGDRAELQYGSDRSAVDPGLNAVLFYPNSYNMNNVKERLALYDQPLPEAKVTVTVYELDTENDGKIGVDFQAWKNGPGTELFTVNSQFMHGMSPQGIVNATQWSNAKYIDFSPRWNTRFLDFLEAKGRAKVIVQGALNIRNNTAGHLSNITGVPYYADGTPVANNALYDYEDILGEWYPWGTPGAADTMYTEYTLRAFDTHGTMITLSANMIPGTIRIARVKDDGNNTIYSLQITEGSGSFVKDGKDLGKKVTECYGVEVLQDSGGTDGVFTGWTAHTFNWMHDANMMVQRGFRRATRISYYGFEMDIVPTICEESTTLDIHMENTSLLGFTENANGGAALPRTNVSTVNVRLMCDNKYDQFFIGGLEKLARVRSVSKVPWLGSIPLLGYLFSSESEVTKKTKLVAVVQCKHQSPSEVPGADFDAVKSKISKSTKALDSNTYGFDQFLLDPDKKKPAPLP